MMVHEAWTEIKGAAKSVWWWERLRVGGEGDDRGWDGWMASLMPWTWVWVNSGRWWWTGRPGVLHSTGSQRLGHDLAAEQTTSQQNPDFETNQNSQLWKWNNVGSTPTYYILHFSVRNDLEHLFVCLSACCRYIFFGDVFQSLSS